MWKKGIWGKWFDLRPCTKESQVNTILWQLGGKGQGSGCGWISAFLCLWSESCHARMHNENSLFPISTPSGKSKGRVWMLLWLPLFIKLACPFPFLAKRSRKESLNPVLSLFKLYPWGQFDSWVFFLPSGIHNWMGVYDLSVYVCGSYIFPFVFFFHTHISTDSKEFKLLGDGILKLVMLS